MGKSKNDPLSHEEIWDDSALVRSWDDAVEEYQLYHSIQAKGEDVEDVLKRAQDEAISHVDALADEDEVMEGGGAEMVVEAEIEYEPQDRLESANAVPDESASLKTAPAQPEVSTAAPLAAPTMPMPEAVMANVQDENLKRLMMSWYYAGYYTGLYEGQQQAKQGKQ